MLYYLYKNLIFKFIVNFYYLKNKKKFASIICFAGNVDQYNLN